MKLVVCVKQIPHIYVQSGYDPVSKDLVTEGLVHMINPHDEAAVEEAIRLKEIHGGTVAVVTMGPETCESVLRWGLAMGADGAVHGVDNSGSTPNPWRTASALAQVVRRIGADLVFFGKKALDDELGLTGFFAAELLGFPVVSAVSKIVSVDPDHVTVLRSLERGNREEVLCPIPAVLTVDKSINRPRYPTFTARKAAGINSIEKWPVPSTDFDHMAIETVKLAPPKLKPKKILSPDSSLSAAARINFVMTGGMGQKKGETVAGNPKQMASGIVEFLKERKIVGS
jgi:electron transfer flavoprotein beta subunit